MWREDPWNEGWEREGDGAQGAGGAEDGDMAPSSDQTANGSLLPSKPQPAAARTSLPL